MRVVVVGGGVIGLWCARDLARSGARVVVLDGPAQPAASTRASAGWVVPVLSSPLSGPGIVADSARAMLRREAAFSFRSMTPDLARWMRAFVAAGSPWQYAAGQRATVELAGNVREAYAALRAEHDFELHDTGLLMVARTTEGRAEAEHLAADAAAAGYAGKSEHLDVDGMHDRESALAPGVIGGVHARDEFHIHPDALLEALRNSAQDAGVRIVSSGVRALVPATGGRWTVLTDNGSETADRVVVAAGYWSRALLSTVDVQIPLASAAGFSVTARIAEPPALPLKLVEANVAVTPFDEGVRLAGRFALGRPPAMVSQRQLRKVVEASRPYLRDWRPESVSAEYVGLRPVTPDSLPLIGEVPGRPGLLAATGHGMLGLTLAPGTAAEVVHQLCTGEVSESGARFALDRFTGARSR